MANMESRHPARVSDFPYDEEHLLKNLQNALDRVQWRRHIHSAMIQSEGIKARKFVQPSSWDIVVGEFEEMLIHPIRQMR